MSEVLRFGNADISAFTNIWRSVNAGISAFTYMTTVCRFGNADIYVFTIGHKKCSSVNTDNCAFTLFVPSTQLVNADISAFSALNHYKFNECILIKLHYTCIFNRLDFNQYYVAYDSTFYGRLF